jgi:Na+/glutamate symporter
MSGAVTAAAVGTAAATFGASAATAATIGLGAGTMVANKRAAKTQLESQQRAQNQNLDMAKSTQKQATESFNAANQKTPDISGIIAGNARKSKGGQASTMLTGSGGISNDLLNLSYAKPLGA